MNVSDIRTCIRHFLGLFLSIVVGHSVALEGFLFKFVGSESSFKCVFYMSAWLMLSTIPCLCYSRKKLGFDLENLVNILVSSVGLGVAMVLSLSAYKFAPVADAFTLYYSNAVFSLVLESIAFRVYPQKLHILAIFLTLLGIITVSQPPFIFNHFQSDSEDFQNDTLDDTRFLGCVLAVAAAITTSVWMLFLRRIENLNITFITFLQALVPVLGYNVFGAFAPNQETFCIKGNLFAMSLLCINYCVNLPLLNLCLKLEPSYIVTSVRCIATVTSYVIQVLRGEQTSWYTFMGASFIVASVLIVSFTKWRDSVAIQTSIRTRRNSKTAEDFSFELMN